MAGCGMGPQGAPKGLGTCHSTLTLAAQQHTYHPHCSHVHSAEALSSRCCGCLIPQTALLRGSLYALISCHSQPDPHVHSHPSQGPVPPHRLEPTSHLNTVAPVRCRAVCCSDTVTTYTLCSTHTLLPSVPTYLLPLAFCSPLPVSRMSTGFLASIKSNTSSWFLHSPSCHNGPFLVSSALCCHHHIPRSQSQPHSIRGAEVVYIGLLWGTTAACPRLTTCNCVW